MEKPKAKSQKPKAKSLLLKAKSFSTEGTEEEHRDHRVIRWQLFGSGGERVRRVQIALLPEYIALQ